MKNIDLKKVLGLLGAILRCPVCGYGYNLETMRVVDSQGTDAAPESQVLIHSDCQQCKGSVMFSIGIRGAEIVSAASVTDLTLADTHHFRDMEAITPDQVLDVHTHVQQLKGDFVKLFGREAIRKAEAESNNK